MRRVIRTTVVTFGTLAGLAGIEHGIGEILQGNVAPAAPVILSWPGSPAFEILGGEPALTLIPNLLVTGILAILCSVLLIAWSVLFAHKKHGGLVMILLAVVALLVGAGFGPPLLWVIAGLTATRIDAPLTRWQSRRLLGALWPWAYAGALAAWLLLCPGSIILDRAFTLRRPELLVLFSILASFGLLFLTVLASLAHDARSRWHSQEHPGTASRRLVARDGRA